MTSLKTIPFYPSWYLGKLWEGIDMRSMLGFNWFVFIFQVVLGIIVFGSLFVFFAKLVAYFVNKKGGKKDK